MSKDMSGFLSSITVFIMCLWLMSFLSDIAVVGIFALMLCVAGFLNWRAK